MSLHLHTAERTDALADGLAELLVTPLPDPFAREIVAHPKADFLYSDEDKIEPDGRHVDPFLKPDWSPEFFETCMFTCHLGVYRTELVRRLGGFRAEFDFAQDYDLALRVVAAIERDGPGPVEDGRIRAPHADRIRHVHDVLYHWRKLPSSTATGNEAKPTAEQAARRARASARWNRCLPWRRLRAPASRRPSGR